MAVEERKDVREREEEEEDGGTPKSGERRRSSSREREGEACGEKQIRLWRSMDMRIEPDVTREERDKALDVTTEPT